MKQLLCTAMACTVVLAACQTQPARQQSSAPEPTAEETVVPSKIVPVYVMGEESTGVSRFFRVLGPVSCTGNGYIVATKIKECTARTCKEGSCFTDSINIQRQNSVFTPRINQSDAILYDSRDILVGKPRGGAGTLLLSMLQYRGQDLQYIEINGMAVQWAVPTNDDFEAAFQTSKAVDRYLRLQRPTLFRTIRENKLVEHLPKLHNFMPDKPGIQLEDWARSSDNLSAVELMVDLQDPEAKSLSVPLEKLLRYSRGKDVRIASARMLIKLGNRDIVELVSKEPSDVQMTLKSLLLNS